jgi:tetratricopeptide (TPR) repeat protein
MKTNTLLILICLSLLTPTLFGQTNAPADGTNAAPAITTISPFQEAVMDYQQKGSLFSDAEKVAKLTVTMDTLPPIPKEARGRFVTGQTMLDTNNFSQARTEFYAAINNAPWWAEAWYKFALSCGAADDYSSALNSLKVYEDFKLSDDEAHQARDKDNTFSFWLDVAAYQRPPNYFLDAENIAKFAARMDTLPPLPAEARRHFVMGQTIFSAAASTNDFQQAFTEFQLASTNAPWVAKIWFNMALAAEADGRYDLATNCLQVYQDFKLSDADAQEAQDKVYEIQAKEDLVTKHAADEQAKLQEAAKAQQQSFVGKWYLGDSDQFIEIIDSSSAQSSDRFGMPQNNGQCSTTGNGSIADFQISGRNMKFTLKLVEDRNWSSGFHQSWYENDDYDLTISEDGTKLTGRYLPHITSNGQDLNPSQNTTDCKLSKRD